VPFFRRHKTLCFIWPGFILWGKKRAYDGVRFGFTYGKQLSDDQNLLNLDNRKQVAYIDFKAVNEIPFEQIQQWLFESVLLDEEAFKAKRKNS